MKVFLSAPISGFESPKEYLIYKEKIHMLTAALRCKYDIYCEVECIESADSYDDPQKAVINDFLRIREANVFILHHPKKTQTSSFIELGYSFALNKTIIIVANTEDLPYLALGLPKVAPNVFLLPSSEITDRTIDSIIELLQKIEKHQTNS